jgi:enamine deaminase RidA (YjgF/YER057c/UK114 family)
VNSTDNNTGVIRAQSIEPSLRAVWALAALLFVSLGAGPWAATVVRTRYPAGQGKDHIAKVVSVNRLVFPSGAMATSGDIAQQVDQVVEQIHRELGDVGLGIGNMIQHTIYVRDGAVQPMQVLNRFHVTARKLAPSLVGKASAGTILRVPSFPDPSTLVALDVIAANPGKGQTDTFTRYRFKAGPQEIVETVTVDDFVYTAGLEAMDFVTRVTPPNDLDRQVEIIVGKIQSALQTNGLSIGNMVSHNLYVTKGTSTGRVIQKFHEAARKLAPGLAKQPSVGTLAVVNGMASPAFLMEFDVIAAHAKPRGQRDDYRRFLFVPPMDIAESVEVDDVIFLAGMEGGETGGRTSPDVMRQVEIAVKKVDDTLRKSGLSIANMVKHKLYIKNGQDVKAVTAQFHKAAQRLAPGLAKNPSAETVIVVEGLAGESLLFEVSAIAAR